MLADYPAGTQLRGLLKGNGVVKPRSAHEPRAAFVHVTFGFGHGVAHAVHQADAGLDAFGEGDFHRFIGDELGLSGGDGPPRAALGQFIPGAFLQVDVGDVGHDKKVHEPFNESGLPRSHRAHHAYVNAAGGPLRDMGKNVKLFHLGSPPKYRRPHPHKVGQYTILPRAEKYNSILRQPPISPSKAKSPSGALERTYRCTFSPNRNSVPLRRRSILLRWRYTVMAPTKTPKSTSNQPAPNKSSTKGRHTATVMEAREM